MKMLQLSILDAIEEALTSSQEDSLANPTQAQENAEEKKMNAIYGQKCLEQFEKLNPNGLWAKTFAALLIGMEGWYSRRCNLSWKLKGTKSNRFYFQLQASTRHTKEIESGLLLKTPCAADSYTENLSKKEQKFGNSGTLAQEVATGFIEKRGIMLLTPTAVMTDESPEKMRARAEKNGYKNGTKYGSLLSQVKYGMLPTPTAGDGMRGINANTTTFENGRFVRTSQTTGTKFGASLGQAAATGMLPTPMACDYMGTRTPQKWEEDKAKYKEKGQDLQMSLRQMARLQILPTQESIEEEKTNGKTSQLNPRFVEEMMGFPENWTVSPFLSGETNP